MSSCNSECLSRRRSHLIFVRHTIHFFFIMAPRFIPDRNFRREPLELGAGSFGRVISGTFRGEPAAAKWIENGEQQEMALEEIKTLEKLQHHSNLIAILGSKISPTRVSIIFPKCMMDLSVWIRINQTFDRRDFFSISELFFQIISPIIAMHRSGFIHRDIKTANYLVTFDGRLKLADMGLAIKHFRGISPKRLIAGTDSWMHYKIWDEDEPFYRTEYDLFAGCLVFARILTGLHPYSTSQYVSNLLQKEGTPFKIRVEDKDLNMFVFKHFPLALIEKFTAPIYYLLDALLRNPCCFSESRVLNVPQKNPVFAYVHDFFGKMMNGSEASIFNDDVQEEFKPCPYMYPRLPSVAISCMSCKSESQQKRKRQPVIVLKNENVY